ncbi:hypothetical protein [Streptomyces sp. NPDC002328]|uniref:hypothetical protein n=1 Tax=Streptomyces sp. NPDC002328 TaxID=3364642 RepID=UPI0036A05460
MDQRISVSISVVGVMASALLLVVGVRDYGDGESALWPVLGACVFGIAAYTLVRDVRQLRARRRG